jgi:hypothetical protein
LPHDHMNYIVKIDFQPEFEISSDELVRRVKENRIPSTALARRIDSDIWKPLTKYPEFLYLIPPPLPQAPEVLKPRSSENMEKVSAKKKTSILAILSLLCGLISFGGATIFSAIPAIILGHISLRKIRGNSNLKGEALAKSGIILGYLFFIVAAIVIGSITFPAVSKSLKKAKQISDSKQKTTNISLQEVKGKGLDYSFYVPADWIVKHETSGFDSVAALNNEIFGVIIQNSEYNSMSDLVNEVVTKVESQEAYDIKLDGLRHFNGVSWTVVKFKFSRKDQLNDSIFYLLSQNGYTVRLGFTSINTPLEDRMESANQILESFKLPNPIKP